MDRYSEAKNLATEIEELILEKNSLIADKNDLNTENIAKKAELRELQIKTDNTISNERERLRAINAEFISELDTKQSSVAKHEEWLFVLLAYIKVQLNKSEKLSDFLDKNFTIVELHEQLEKEIEIYRIHNRELEAKFQEADENTKLMHKLMEIQCMTNESLTKAKKICVGVRIDREKLNQELEAVDKQKIFLAEERQRIDIEWIKIKSDWKMLENTKNYLKGKNG